MIKPSTVLDQNRDLIRRIVTSHRTTNPRVFGSVAHGTDTETSDLDLLVDTLPGTSLFDLGAIQYELEQSLGISIDLLTPGDIPASFRDDILREAMPV